LRVLKGGRRAIFTAASKVQQAAEHLVKLSENAATFPLAHESKLDCHRSVQMVMPSMIVSVNRLDTNAFGVFGPIGPHFSLL
jgi:hypothetical protein